MKLSDLEKVKKLVEIKDRCISSISDLTEFIEMSKEDLDCGGLENYNVGYHGAFFDYKDGSGKGTCMHGCYVGVEAATALIEVLNVQGDRVNTDLRELGIELDR